ncbi:MAG TPA: hypothetical protein VLH75_06420 [Longimicrobiales bacterium]|nr:hypothetical protein [Longimicrobiales bacterium]
MTVGWRRARSASQVIWLAAVLGFAARFAWRHADELAALELAARWGFWALALGLLLGAKILISLMVHASWRAAGADLGLVQAAYTYNVSQLPKYVPGGIWPYVSRVGMARARDLEMPRIWRGLALETAMLLGGAVALAAMALDASSLLPALGMAEGGAWIGVARIGALACLAVGLAVVAGRAPHRGALARAVLLSLGAWALLALSFLAVVHALAGGAPVTGGGAGVSQLAPVSLAGLYAFAWILGFVAVFSPAGIGVREVILGVGLAGLGGPALAAAIVVGHRLLYLVADALCALAAVAFLRPGRR